MVRGVARRRRLERPVVVVAVATVAVGVAVVTGVTGVAAAVAAAAVAAAAVAAAVVAVLVGAVALTASPLMRTSRRACCAASQPSSTRWGDAGTAVCAARAP